MLRGRRKTCAHGRLYGFEGKCWACEMMEA